MHAKLNSTKKIQKEISLLKLIYNSSYYSFMNTLEYNKKKIREKKISKRKTFYINEGTNKELSFNSIAELNRGLKKNFLKHTRGLLLIRLVSALEVYFIDSIKELFVKRKDLFRKLDKKMEFHYYTLFSAKSISEIWTSLINKECRHLQNNGFKSIWQYYKNKLKIDFNESGIPLVEIKKMYDTRHLLVHRLGKTDAIFRKEYYCQDKRIYVSEEDLFQYLENVNELTGFLDSKLKKLIDEQKDEQEEERETLLLSIEIIDEDRSSYLFSNSYSFFHDDSLYLLKDFIKEFQKKGNLIDILLEGRYDALMCYKREIKKLKKEGSIKVLKKVHKHSIQRLSRKINPEDIGRVKSMLPKGSWEKGIHKNIAKELELSNSKVSKIINCIIESEKKSKLSQLPQSAPHLSLSSDKAYVSSPQDSNTQPTASPTKK